MTSKHSALSDDHPCYTDYALQEFCMGRLSEPVATAIEAHLTTCDACRAMDAEIRLEQAYFSQVAKIEEKAPSNECLRDEQLGQFVDNSVKSDSKINVEFHVSTCYSCRGRLIELYRQIREVMEIAYESGGIGAEETPKPTLVLTMTKRKPISASEQLPRFTLRDTGTDV
jgi:predicted anti-sigma-YlaC factor YlaD